MILREMVERMEKNSPMCVMLRAMLENVFAAERLDRLFDDTALRQENKTLLFSSVAEIIGLVALRIRPSVHAAFVAKKAELAVTAKAVYDKLQRLEPRVSQALVRDSAEHLAKILDHLPGSRTTVLPGYRVKILDGNHLRRTERRIGELRALNAAPLPGQCLVVLDPQRQLVVDAFPCEDGHAQERALLGDVLATVEAHDLWIDDRNFCTAKFLGGILRQRAFFLVRQHAQSPRTELVGKRRRIGRSETGTVYEQALRMWDDQDQCVTIRRVTVVLEQSTRDGDQEIHLLTNLPPRIGAIRVAELYRSRWTIETAFQQIAENLEGEIETLGYPRAALFSFCMALVAFNLVSVLQTTLRIAQPKDENASRISFYYVCDEISHTYRGLTLILDDSHWEQEFATLTPRQLARRLLKIARGVNLEQYRKYPRGPKKPPPKMKKQHRNHISTARVLAKSRNYKTGSLC
jgi:IS4 transposase